MADAVISRTIRMAEPGEGRGRGVTKRAEPPPTRDRGGPVAPPPPPRWRHYLWLVALGLFVVLYLFLPATGSQPHESLTYSGFLRRLAAKHVETVAIASDGQVSGELANGHSYSTVIPTQAGQELLTKLEDNGVQITATVPEVLFGSQVLSRLVLVLPLLGLGYLWWRMSKRATGRVQGALGVGRSNAKVFDAERPSTTFADVAGYEGAKVEIREVVDFLRGADRYAKAGAKAPRGVLMVGPPGTDKTLLARAVAGEAAVPFFSVTGSSFVEMFVGVGAARLRDLFAEPRKRAPAIIFVDEIDAIGQRRADSGAVVTNDEREQTPNQLPAEMDGFNPATGVIVLTATNRPEVLEEHRDVHAALVALLLERETVDGEEIYALAGRTPAAGGTPIGPRDAVHLSGREEHPDAGRPATVARDASAPARTARPRRGEHRSHE